MGFLTLRPEESRKIRTVLTSAFVTGDQLDQFTAEHFSHVHGRVRWSAAKDTIIHEILTYMNAEGQLDRFLVEASNERPFRSDLRQLALQLSLCPGWSVVLTASGLDLKATMEGLTIGSNPFVSTGELTRWLIQVERQVCVVRCGSERGTGFLVARDLVLTNYHVVAHHLLGQVPHDKVKVRFDFRTPPGGGDPPAYDEDLHGLDEGWMIPYAPCSKADAEPFGEPEPHELDYAVLKLTEPVGDHSPPGESLPRGWVDLSVDRPPPPVGAPMLIVQHPRSDRAPPPQRPLQISFATPGFNGQNRGGTRLIYRPSTLNGSSGSPVFDGTLRAVALHHSGGDNTPSAGQVHNNRGIPLSCIRAALPPQVRDLLIAP